MRILHVTDVYRPRVGGIEMFIEELALRQHAAGHEVTVLTSTGEGSTGDAPAGGAGTALPVVRAPAGGYVPLRSLPVSLEDYDVVHAHLSVVSVFATRVAKLAARSGVAVVNTVHSMWNGREGWVRIVRDLAAWDRYPPVWTSVSEAAAAPVRDVLRPGEPVHVVPNAVDVDWWRAGPPLPRDRGGTVTLVSVMRLAGRKRPLPLLDVLAGLRHVTPPDQELRAVLVGEGPQEARIRAHLADLDVADWVELPGQCSREQIRDLYRTSDLYLAPSFQESFGIAALEARTVGLPVVAMSSGGVGEFVRHGVEGLLCEDDAELGAALASLVASASLRQAMTEHNRRHRPVHDWSSTLRGFEEVYAAARAGVAGPRPARMLRLR